MVRFTAITLSPVELGDVVTVVVMVLVLVETEVSVVVEVFDACPTAKNRLADTRHARYHDGRSDGQVAS